jgi:hypothetical protein
MFRAGLEYWLSVPSSIEDKANDNDTIERQSIVFDKNVYIVANGISKISKARRLSTYGYDIRYWTEDSKELVRLVKEPPESYKRLTRQFDLGYPEVVDNDDYFGGVSEPVQDYVLNNSRFLAVWVKEATLDAKGREDYYSSKYDYLDRKTLGMESTDLDNILQTELYNYLGERLNRYGSHMKRSRNVLVK